MSYYFKKETVLPFEAAVKKVTENLKAEGFGVLTEIDVSDTLKQKLDVDLKPYRILGACNPPFAYEALKHEPHIGTMLPCNVIVRSLDSGNTEVAAVDPVASMSAVPNPDLQQIADEVRNKLRKVIERL